ncbi:hypothetical protein D9757_002115 [Collybiopsis confluens]|uniref:Micro-fibrillar-associated protein 1 C-terminal domain-containing protein n=1 Tax=Collybiopsis confluens TaxID=2823264 RepID=A0A8H5HZV6_9AGAR|nr:hypothetical protein D9757_002115 [Collybiopsis confluens]
MSSKPKQAPRLARPVARYWAGKAPRDHLDSESDSNDDDEEQQGVEDEGVVNMGGEQDFTQGEPEEEEDQELSMKQDIAKTKSMNIALRDVNISRDGKVIVAGRVESGRTAVEEDEESEEESEEDIKPKIKAEHEESGEDSSEYESGSEEEKPRLQFRPVFVSKRNRETVSERDKIAQDSEEALKRKELEQEERRKQSHDMVAESIRRELAEKEKEEEVPDIDDIDGLDPEGEFEAWRLRELGRIKKEKEEMIIRDQEREEIERRRAMPEEQRLKEDLERAQKLRDEKPKGQQKFLQKYWHKGAFHQDEEILKGRDFTEATESTVDVSLLPKVMQVKNFGKRSRTKYTHLLDQDTTVPTGGFGGTAPVKAGGKSTETGGCFTCGGPHLKKGEIVRKIPVPFHSGLALERILLVPAGLDSGVGLGRTVMRERRGEEVIVGMEAMKDIQIIGRAVTGGHPDHPIDDTALNESDLRDGGRQRRAQGHLLGGGRTRMSGQDDDHVRRNRLLNANMVQRISDGE